MASTSYALESEEAIEVDPAVLENEEEDDYAATGYDTSTASLSSSINEYIYENGRRYHNYFGVDKNPQPTDEIEQDRLDLHHEIFLQLVEGLHKAPIKDPQRILDIGTGTGIWAIDMADRYPAAEVIGTDLSTPVQSQWVPPNCRFEVDDAEREWTYRSDSFDFIHLRNLVQAVTDWPKLLSQAYRCTAPGKCIELAELCCITHSDDGTMPETHSAKRFMDLLGAAMQKLRRPAYVDDESLKRTSKKLEKRLKHVGAMTIMSAESGYHSYGMQLFTRMLGMETEEAEKACRDAVAATKNKNYHKLELMLWGGMKLCCVWAEAGMINEDGMLVRLVLVSEKSGEDRNTAQLIKMTRICNMKLLVKRAYS
ncbi:S-adenosyl-L-methionine-dependent methyltransferase [Trichophaea hybrida]|nr:S-adenosyl-L-methionine-dependent methyltransferase [Trichophaea hybrida]